MSTTATGQRGRPPRTYLAQVERGNPVEVRTSKQMTGKPTGREAQSLSGNRMTQEANAGQLKGTGKPGRHAAPPGRVPHNRPDTGNDARTRKGADVGQVSL
jgi:hypothetical protein